MKGIELVDFIEFYPVKQELVSRILGSSSYLGQQFVKFTFSVKLYSQSLLIVRLEWSSPVDVI